MRWNFPISKLIPFLSDDVIVLSHLFRSIPISYFVENEDKELLLIQFQQLDSFFESYSRALVNQCKRSSVRNQFSNIFVSIEETIQWLRFLLPFAKFFSKQTLLYKCIYSKNSNHSWKLVKLLYKLLEDEPHTKFHIFCYMYFLSAQVPNFQCSGEDYSFLMNIFSQHSHYYSLLPLQNFSVREASIVGPFQNSLQYFFCTQFMNLQHLEITCWKMNTCQDLFDLFQSLPQIPSFCRIHSFVKEPIQFPPTFSTKNKLHSLKKLIIEHDYLQSDQVHTNLLAEQIFSFFKKCIEQDMNNILEPPLQKLEYISLFEFHSKIVIDVLYENCKNLKILKVPFDYHPECFDKQQFFYKLLEHHLSIEKIKIDISKYKITKLLHQEQQQQSTLQQQQETIQENFNMDLYGFNMFKAIGKCSSLKECIMLIPFHRRAENLFNVDTVASFFEAQRKHSPHRMRVLELKQKRAKEEEYMKQESLLSWQLFFDENYLKNLLDFIFGYYEECVQTLVFTLHNASLVRCICETLKQFFELHNTFTLQHVRMSWKRKRTWSGIDFYFLFSNEKGNHLVFNYLYTFPTTWEQNIHELVKKLFSEPMDELTCLFESIASLANFSNYQLLLQQIKNLRLNSQVVVTKQMLQQLKVFAMDQEISKIAISPSLSLATKYASAHQREASNSSFFEWE